MRDTKGSFYRISSRIPISFVQWCYPFTFLAPVEILRTGAKNRIPPKNAPPVGWAGLEPMVEAEVEKITKVHARAP